MDKDKAPRRIVFQPQGCSGFQLSLGAAGGGSIRTCRCHYGEPVIPVQAYYPSKPVRRG